MQNHSIKDTKFAALIFFRRKFHESQVNPRRVGLPSSNVRRFVDCKYENRANSQVRVPCCVLLEKRSYAIEDKKTFLLIAFPSHEGQQKNLA